MYYISSNIIQNYKIFINKDFELYSSILIEEANEVLSYKVIKN